MRSGNKILSSEEVQNIVKLYKGGKNSLQIERETGRDHSTILGWLDKLGVPRHPAQRTLKPRMEKLCPCGCGRKFFTMPSSMKIYYSPECYQKDHANNRMLKEKPSTTCSKCKKEISKECAKLNNGKCFMCDFKSRKILPQ